jgi:hypothetical protein
VGRALHREEHCCCRSGRYDTYSNITATYQAGYTTTPPELDQAMLLLIGHWFENREGVVVGATNETLEYAIEALAGPFRTPTIA